MIEAPAIGYTESRAASPAPPAPRGVISGAVLSALRGGSTPVLESKVVAAAEPALDADVAFGIQATGLLEDALGTVLLHAWRDGRSALRIPLETADPRPGCL